MGCRAIAFDTGGTVLDWHGSIVDELALIEAWQGLAFDRHELINERRRRTMKGIVGQVRPAFDMDDLHLRALDDTLGHLDLNAAMDAGMHTAFVRRPDEWGPSGPPDPNPNRAYDHVVDGFDELQRQVLALT